MKNNFHQIFSKVFQRKSIITAKERLSLDINRARETWKSLLNYLDSVKDAPNFKTIYQHILNSQVISMWAYIEAFIQDVLIGYFYAKPDEIAKKQLSLEDIVKHGMAYKVIKSVAEEKANTFLHNNLSKILDKLHPDLLIKKISNDTTNALCEFKATRNCIVHNNSIVDDKYLEMAKENAREKEILKTLPLEPSYIEFIFQKISSFIDEFYESISDSQMYNTGIANAIKIMWEGSLLEKTLAFNDAFVLENPDIIDTTETMDGRLSTNAFSHSEMDIIRFILYVLNLPGGNIDLIKIHYHFLPTSNERLMIDSWLEHQIFRY